MAQSLASRRTAASPFAAQGSKEGGSKGGGPRRAQQTLAMLKQKQLEIEFKLEDTPYSPVQNLGTGAYGVVCSAVDTRNEKKVAIKKIPKAFGALTLIKRTLREVQILRHFRHENIVAVLDMFQADGTLGNDVYMVMDLMETDLHQIIHSRQALSEQHLQYFMYQILRGLKYIHSAGVIHRDLKPSNLLVNADCLLKIGDFGMARSLGQLAERTGPMTQYVATRWYRAPELVFSMLDYTTQVDLWSVGCIFAELIMRRQLFPGKDHVSQLKLIVSFLGTPADDVMDKISSDIVKTLIKSMGVCAPLPWASILPKATQPALDLVGKMMEVAPWLRCSAEDALRHPYLESYHDPEMEPVCSKHVVLETDNLESLTPEGLKAGLEESVTHFTILGSHPQSPAQASTPSSAGGPSTSASAFPFPPSEEADKAASSTTEEKAKEVPKEPAAVIAGRRGSSEEEDIHMLSAKMSGRLLEEKAEEAAAAEERTETLSPPDVPPATDSGLNSMGSEAEDSLSEPQPSVPTIREAKEEALPEEPSSPEQEVEINEDVLDAPSSSAQSAVMPTAFPRPRPPSRTLIQHTDSFRKREEQLTSPVGTTKEASRKRPNSLNEEQASLVRRIFSNALQQSRAQGEADEEGASGGTSGSSTVRSSGTSPFLAVFRAPSRAAEPPRPRSTATATFTSPSRQIHSPTTQRAPSPPSRTSLPPTQATRPPSDPAPTKAPPPSSTVVFRNAVPVLPAREREPSERRGAEVKAAPSEQKRKISPSQPPAKEARPSLPMAAARPVSLPAAPLRPAVTETPAPVPAPTPAPAPAKPLAKEPPLAQPESSRVQIPAGASAVKASPPASAMSTESSEVPLNIQFFPPLAQPPSQPGQVEANRPSATQPSPAPAQTPPVQVRQTPRRVGGIRLGRGSVTGPPTGPESPKPMETTSPDKPPASPAKLPSPKGSFVTQAQARPAPVPATQRKTSGGGLYAIKAVSADGRQQIFQPTVVSVSSSLHDARPRQASAEVTVLRGVGTPSTFRTAQTSVPVAPAAKAPAEAAGSPFRVTQYRTISGFGIPASNASSVASSPALSPAAAAAPTSRPVRMIGGRPSYGEQKKRQLLTTTHNFGVREEDLKAAAAPPSQSQLKPTPKPFRTGLAGVRLDASAPRAAAEITVKEPVKPASKSTALAPTADPKVILRNKLVAKQKAKEAGEGPVDAGTTAHERRLEREAERRKRKEATQPPQPNPGTLLTDHDRLLQERWERMEPGAGGGGAAGLAGAELEGSMADLLSSTVSPGKDLDSSSLYSTWVEASQMDPQLLHDLEKEINIS